MAERPLRRPAIRCSSSRKLRRARSSGHSHAEPATHLSLPSTIQWVMTGCSMVSGATAPEVQRSVHLHHPTSNSQRELRSARPSRRRERDEGRGMAPNGPRLLVRLRLERLPRHEAREDGVVAHLTTTSPQCRNEQRLRTRAAWRHPNAGHRDDVEPEEMQLALKDTSRKQRGHTRWSCDALRRRSTAHQLVRPASVELSGARRARRGEAARAQRVTARSCESCAAVTRRRSRRAEAVQRERMRESIRVVHRREMRVRCEQGAHGRRGTAWREYRMDVVVKREK